MASNSPLECGVCNETFNQRERCPRILPCYHHLCSRCIEQLIENSLKSCPFCRRPFEAQCAKDIRINTGVLDLVTFISQQASSSHSEEGKGDGDRDSISSIGSAYSTENASNCLLNTCRDFEKLIDESAHNMDNLTTSLNHQNETISSDIVHHFTEMMANNDSSVQELKTREDRIMDYKKELKQKEEELKILKQRLRTADDKFTEDDDVRKEVEENNAAIGVWVAGLREIINQDTELRAKVSEDIRITTTVMEAVQEAMHSATSDEEKLPAPSAPTMYFPEQPSAPPMNFLEKPRTPTTDISEQCCQPSDSTCQATVSNMTLLNSPGHSGQIVPIDFIKHMTESSMLDIIQGKVYAVQYDGLKTRYARLSIECNVLHLYNLKHQSPPPGVVMLDHNEVISLTTHIKSAGAFLDLCELKAGKGRLYIDLSPSSVGSKNFSLLCTGEKGPSYVKSRFLGIHAKGTDTEALLGGDYEKNSGRGGKTLVTGLDLSAHVYRRRWDAGIIRGHSYDKFGKFYINTKDRPGCVCHGAIGKVIKGFDILKKLIYDYDDNVKDIYIEECGIILPCFFLEIKERALSEFSRAGVYPWVKSIS